MRRSPLLLVIFATALALGPGSRALYTQSTVAVADSLLASVSGGGRALVIVGIDRPLVPEGDLASTADIVAQRDQLHAALDDTMARAEAAGVDTPRRFETIPYFTGIVDAAALAALRALPGITAIVEDTAEPLHLVESVPLVGAPAVWTAGQTGAGWQVAVLDTGVQASHPFFGGRVTQEACFSDSGGAGFNSTSLCPGGASAQTGPGAAADCESSTAGCGHGTHVAGIVAGANGTGPLAGASGVAPGAGIIAVQVFSRFASAAQCGATPAPCARAYVSDQIRGLEHVLALAGPGNANRVAAVNMSLGGGQYFTQAACDDDNGPRKHVIDHLRSIGIATVASAGNSGFPTSLGAPSCISSAVSVSSTTKTDAISSFSNRASFLSLMAPGSAIVSSVPGLGSTAASFNGTSMAAPHVAGAWALLKQAVPGASVSHVLSALQTTGVTIPDGALTHRRIAVDAARTALLASATGVPGAPGAPAISGEGNRLTFTASPPASGGSPVSYTLLARTSPGGPVVATLPLGSANQATVTAPNGTFIVTMRASNGAGAGPESAPTTFAVPYIPPPPGAPLLANWHVAGNRLRMSWVRPFTGGAPTGYRLLAATTSGGAPIATLPVAGTEVDVPNIPPGTYFLRVVAVNGGGVGQATEEANFTVTATGPGTPGTPVMLPATVAGGQIRLQWYPAQSGAFPWSYTVRASVSPGGPVVASLSSTGTTITVPAPPGTYYVHVVAHASTATSAASNQVVVTVP